MENYYVGKQKQKAMSKYYMFMKEWNERTNLISKREMDKGFECFMNNHVCDALIVSNHIEEWKGKRIADVGTGAGLPGIPLYISHDSEIEECILIESNGKKVSFLQHIEEQMNFDKVKILGERAEKVGRDSIYREKIDYVFIRAVGNIHECLELTMPLVKVGGEAYIYKGEISEKQKEFSTDIASKFGGKLENIVEYCISGMDRVRNLLIFRKILPINDKFPGKSGSPGKKSKKFL